MRCTSGCLAVHNGNRKHTSGCLAHVQHLQAQLIGVGFTALAIAGAVEDVHQAEFGQGGQVGADLALAALDESGDARLTGIAETIGVAGIGHGQER
ncbi:MAG TPA: hypothetical protein VLQ88_10515 [Chromatiaceae bacterium]|nr:hypothetical protein [Chromatiaceae bacterium]